MIKIFVDHREVASGVVLELEDLDANVEVLQLEVGDYIASTNVCIERKTTDDFITSVIDKKDHLFSQLSDMKREYKQPVLIVEGDWMDLFTTRMINPDAIRGIIASIAVDFAIPIIPTTSIHDTAAMVYRIAWREQTERVRTVSYHGKRSHLDPEEQLVFVTSAIPDLGTKKAIALLNQFHSIERIFTASVEELQETPGIGKKLANHITELANRRYK